MGMTWVIFVMAWVTLFDESGESNMKAMQDID